MVRKLVVSLSLFFIATETQATIVADTFGNTGLIYQTQGYVLKGAQHPTGSFDLAFQFTPTESGALARVSAAIIFGSLSVDNDIQLAITTDAGGLPGSVLESFLFTGLDSVPHDGMEFISALASETTMLQAGTPYWITAVPGSGNTFASWGLSLLDLILPRAVRCGATSVLLCSSPDVWTIPSINQTVAAFRIDVSPLGPIPEPSTALLLASGLVGLAMRRRAS